MRACLLLIVLVVAQLQRGLSGPATVPAFLWSSQDLESYNFGSKRVVNYQTITPKGLADSVLSEGGWSRLVCLEDEIQQKVDVALIFIGRKLQTSDISKSIPVDPALIDILKVHFSSSNFSMAFPYVAKSDEKTLESSIISEFNENCERGMGGSHVASLGACILDGESSTTLADLNSLHDHLNLRMAKRMKGQTDLIVFCNNDSEQSDVLAEGDIFSELMNLLEKLGATYSVLYASDPLRSSQYSQHGTLDRFLVEQAPGNNSTYCDGVCQIKSSLLEGVFVGIVLLIILLSGLCCMMGISTPTRFEIPQES